MTEQRCDHYEVCRDTVAFLRDVLPEGKAPCVRCESTIAIAEGDKCPHDTRSRPHTPAAPEKQDIQGFVMLERQRDFVLWLQQHDATIRNQTLDKYEEVVKIMKDESSCISDAAKVRERVYHEGSIFAYDRILAYIYKQKSLRHQSTEAKK